MEPQENGSLRWRSIVSGALINPLFDKLDILSGEGGPAMGHADGRVRTVFDEHDEGTGKTRVGNDDRAEFCALHDIFIAGDAEAAFYIPRAPFRVANLAIPFQNGGNVFLEADVTAAAGCHDQHHDKWQCKKVFLRHDGSDLGIGSRLRWR